MELKWDDEQYNMMVGVQEAQVLSSLSDNRNNNVAVLCTFGDSPSIWSLRWAVQVMIDLETDDLDEAKGAVDAMLQMEHSRNE